MNRFSLPAPLRAPLLAIGLLLVAAFPTSAPAATVSVFVMETGFRFLDYEAGAGEINQVEPSVTEDGTVTIHDSGAVILAEAGCSSVDEHTAKCPRISGAATLWLGDLGDSLFSAVDVIGDVYGGAGADTLTTCARCGVQLFGEGGNDRLIGKGGVLLGGSGDDILTGRSLWGESGNDVLNGGGRGDLLDGGAGNDVITAGRGLDDIYPGDGDDTVDAGPGGRDRLLYRDVHGPVIVDLRTGVATGAGTDTFTGVESVLGSERGDLLIGDKNANGLGGGEGSDVIRGGAGADKLSGGDGNDVLKGEYGNDFLIGGLGWDRLFAGPGDDFVRSLDGRRDRVRGQRGHDRARVDRGLDSVRGVEKLL
jgi:Ca2+-binding RTX toxin-like protein